RDDRLRDGLVVGVARDVLDERAVDLHAVDREALEIAERGVARAEVVDRYRDAERLDPLQPLGGVLRVLHRHRLGDLELEEARREPAPVERAPRRGGEPRAWRAGPRA